MYIYVQQAVARVRTNKEDPEFYATVLIKAIFLSVMKASRDSTLKKICEALYCDMERKGLELAV